MADAGATAAAAAAESAAGAVRLGVAWAGGQGSALARMTDDADVVMTDGAGAVMTDDAGAVMTDDAGAVMTDDAGAGRTTASREGRVARGESRGASRDGRVATGESRRQEGRVATAFEAGKTAPQAFLRRLGIRISEASESVWNHFFLWGSGSQHLPVAALGARAREREGEREGEREREERERVEREREREREREMRHTASVKSRGGGRQAPPFGPDSGPIPGPPAPSGERQAAPRRPRKQRGGALPPCRRHGAGGPAAGARGLRRGGVPAPTRLVACCQYVLCSEACLTSVSPILACSAEGPSMGRMTWHLATPRRLEQDDCLRSLFVCRRVSKKQER